jgi:hypothetical protein
MGPLPPSAYMASARWVTWLGSDIVSDGVTKYVLSIHSLVELDIVPEDVVFGVVIHQCVSHGFQ